LKQKKTWVGPQSFRQQLVTGLVTSEKRRLKKSHSKTGDPTRRKGGIAESTSLENYKKKGNIRKAGVCFKGTGHLNTLLGSVERDGTSKSRRSAKKEKGTGPRSRGKGKCRPRGRVGKGVGIQKTSDAP